MDKKFNILVIEDEKHIGLGLKYNLIKEGHEAHWALDGASGLKYYQDKSPDLIILDLMLPGIDGLEVLKTIRKENELLPILILSAKDQKEDIIQGLKLGSDDYLCKPFDLREFILRIEKLLTRAYPQFFKMEKSFEFGPYQINFSSRKAITAQGEVQLTDLENRLLQLFIRMEGKILERGEILESVWGINSETQTRTLDNFIARLRKYFPPPQKEGQSFFKSVRNKGYCFQTTPS